jgi:hypothetical protein
MSMYFVKQGGLPATKLQSQQKNSSPHDMDVVTGPSGPQDFSSPNDEKDVEGGGWLDGNMS